MQPLEVLRRCFCKARVRCRGGSRCQSAPAAGATSKASSRSTRITWARALLHAVVAGRRILRSFSFWKVCAACPSSRSAAFPAISSTKHDHGLQEPSPLCCRLLLQLTDYLQKVVEGRGCKALSISACHHRISASPRGARQCR